MLNIRADSRQSKHSSVSPQSTLSREKSEKRKHGGRVVATEKAVGCQAKIFTICLLRENNGSISDKASRFVLTDKRFAAYNVHGECCLVIIICSIMKFLIVAINELNFVSKQLHTAFFIQYACFVKAMCEVSSFGGIVLENTSK